MFLWRNTTANDANALGVVVGVVRRISHSVRQLIFVNQAKTAVASHMATIKNAAAVSEPLRPRQHASWIMKRN